MKNFKEMVAEDNLGVFLNDEEFADRRTVRYDGETYRNIPVLLTKVMQSKTPFGVATTGERIEGIHRISAVAHMALTHLRGNIPEQKRYIEISDGFSKGEPWFVRYKIAVSDVEMGMVRLELEAFDE